MLRLTLAWACACVLSASVSWAGNEGKRAPKTPTSPATPGKIVPGAPVPIVNLNVPLVPNVPGVLGVPESQKTAANAQPPAAKTVAPAAKAAPIAPAPAAAPPAAAPVATAKEQLDQAALPAGPEPAAAPPAGGESEKDSADQAFENALPRAEGGPAVSIAGAGTTWTGTGAPRLSPAPTRGPPAAAATSLEAKLNRAVERREMPPADRPQWLKVIWVDDLTGVYNRKYIDDHKQTLSKTNSVLLDAKLDDLKEVNDSYDHDTGNILLRSGAAVAAAVIGKEGVVARRSPTSFQVFLDASAQDARLAGEALRAVAERTMGNAAVLLPGPPKVELAAPLRGTISVGIGALAGDPASASRYPEGLERVRRARAVAKEAGGGNTVAVDALIAQALGEAAKDSRAATREELERALEDPSIGQMAAVKAMDAAAGDSRVMDRMELEAAVAALKKGKKAAIGVQAEKTAARPVAELVEELRQASAHRPVRELLERVQNPELRRELFELVYVNPLSLLKNRRWLFDFLSQVLGPEGYLHYIALDIDHFGEKNEKLGEERADLILKELGLMLEEESGGKDALALHLSGEEFVLMTGRRLADPRPFAENVRQKVESELGPRVAEKHGIVDPETGKPLTITVSMGIGRIRRDESGLKPTLDLATAAAEAMLKRAKARGRNRVEIGPGELAAAVARVFRIDVGLRRAIARLTERPEPGELFDNSFKTSREALAGLGFDPAVQEGMRLDDRGDPDSETWLVTPREGPSRVVTIAVPERIQSSLFTRKMILESPYLRAHLSAPGAFAYPRRFRRPVMVAEHVEVRPEGTVPLPHRGAAAALSIGLGVGSLAPEAFLSKDWAGVTLTGFENARRALQPDWNPRRPGRPEDLAHVSIRHLNDLADYRPALQAWKRDWPQLRGPAAAFLRRLNAPESRVAEDLANLDHNARWMEEILKADIAYADRVFRDEAARAGLDEKKTLVLSEVNREAARALEGGVLRDIIRLLNGRLPFRGAASPPAHLAPAELKSLAGSRPAGLTTKDLAAVRRAVLGGQLRSPEGYAYTSEAAGAAAARLDALLKE